LSGAAGSGQHIKGSLLALTGVVVISPDGLLIRLISVDHWTLLFWRGLLIATTLGVAQWAMRGRGIVSAFGAIGRLGVAASLIRGLGMVFFVLAIRHTTVANTLIILGLAPLWGAALSRLFLRETVPLRTWMAIPVALGGIAMAVSAEYGGVKPGDLFALAGSICLATYITFVRHVRHLDMTPSLTISSAFVALAVLPLATPDAIELRDAAFLGIMGLVVMPVSLVLFVMAPRYILAPEVSLIFLLEMALGPYWVWLALGEQPSTQVITGGGVVMVTLAVHTGLALRESLRRSEE
jgi:drug/metabolite transporter (DMT)-like permease